MYSPFRNMFCEREKCPEKQKHFLVHFFWHRRHRKCLTYFKQELLWEPRNTQRQSVSNSAFRLRRWHGFKHIRFLHCKTREHTCLQRRHGRKKIRNLQTRNRHFWWQTDFFRHDWHLCNFVYGPHLCLVHTVRQPSQWEQFSLQRRHFRRCVHLVS